MILFISIRHEFFTILKHCIRHEFFTIMILYPLFLGANHLIRIVFLSNESKTLL